MKVEFLIGMLIGELITAVVLLPDVTMDEHWHKQAIDHNAARYNPTTGDFEWLDTLGGGK